MKKKGFTLLEMIIVLAIMSIIVSIAAPQTMKALQKSKQTADLLTAKTIAVAIQEAMAEGAELSATTGWAKVENNIFTDTTNYTLSNYIENLSSLKPKQNANYDFYYNYNINDNTLKIGVGENNENPTVIYPEPESSESGS
ncbi:putative major pilin subunit [Caloramator mitchellensis]|uniref:Putative major pilin subunit n=1 Tax=Caloramator mitchellensis TaxID=908809 RepID=A0A0R3JW95_CALMK|nr:type II secretion system protein [Caloramator mitchellensis]KRQ87831.1 putative major pilin subunit [Caloramator mitchellensis]